MVRQGNGAASRRDEQAALSDMQDGEEEIRSLIYFQDVIKIISYA